MNAKRIFFSTAAAVTVASVIGFAYAQNSNLPAGSPQTQSTPNGPPASDSTMQNQRQPAAPGSMTTDSSGSANTASPAGNMNGGTGSTMNSGTAPTTTDTNSNIRRSTATRNGTNERTARPDRN